MSAPGKKPPSGLIGAGLLIVDKPAGLTSHDVVARCRKLFKTRRVGHAGTLDPMATGVLVLGIERATKLLGLLALTTKSYTATIRLGQSTTTDDAEGEASGGAPAHEIAEEDWRAEIAKLTGSISQVPSTVSAIKIDGQRAHKRVRDGEEVVIPARDVMVDRFEVLGTRVVGEYLDLDVEVDCSSGTYIRALARDIGAALGVGGHLTVLRRTRVGPFGLDGARTLDELAEHAEVNLPIDEAVRTAFPLRDISADEAEAISQGRWLETVGIKGVYGVVDPGGNVIALLKEEGRRAASVLVVRPATLRD
ncbi:tRNA pseudouridine(55) synthase TruB [Tomitella biformata]|uniref:tRNA pseudouridine(55) synthase TruB n=1 Tax=Tomitella biformata TaxID=630403 RepID=UPI0004638D7E|nr:tRNA pseudouridine(55) synthase TruB [Tomitella biformata]